MSVVVAFAGAKEPTGSPDPCAADYELDVEEHTDMVRLSVWGKPTSSATSVTCPAVGYFRTVSASLAAPLGDRAVVAAGSSFQPVQTSFLLVPTPMPEGWRLLQESGNSASTPDGMPLRLQWSQAFGPREGAGLQVTMSWGVPCDETTFGPGATPAAVRGVDGLLLPPALAGPALQWREGEACVRLIDLSAGPPTELIAAAERLAPSTRTD